MSKELFFFENLKFYRKNHGLTQKQLADKIGYSEKAVNKWENTQTVPSIYTIVDICEILHISLYDLLFERRAEKFYLGIDGGASKTSFILSDENLNIVKRVEKASSNPNDIGIEAAFGILKEGIDEVCLGYSYDKIYMFAGLSGGSIDGNYQAIADFLKKFGFAHFRNGSDLENIKELSIRNEKGIIAIMGTGFSTYAVNGSRQKRIGGWGQFFDKGGSGYNIGRDGIYAAFCEIDGSGPKTMIRELIEKQINTAVDEHLSVFYKKGKRYIALFCKEVFEAYKQGDSAAIEIVRDNLKEVARILEAGRQFIGEDKVNVFFAGSLLNDNEIIFGLLNEFLEKGKFTLNKLDTEPVFGALQIAKRESAEIAQNAKAQ